VILFGVDSNVVVQIIGKCFIYLFRFQLQITLLPCYYIAIVIVISGVINRLPLIALSNGSLLPS
jgi:hypothetical protein